MTTRTPLAAGIPILLAFLAASAASAQTPYEAGRRFLEEKRYEEALHEAAKVIADERLAPFGHHLRGLALYGLGDYEASRDAFLRALELAEEDAELRESSRRNAAMACTATAMRAREAGRTAIAREAAERAVAIDGAYGHAYYTLGGILMGLREYGKAEESLGRFLELAGGTARDRAWARTWIGQIAMDEGELGRARAAFAAALEEDAGFEEAKRNLDLAGKAIEGVERTARTETRLALALAGLLLFYAAGGFAAYRMLKKRDLL